MTDTIRERVERGAKWLDSVEPQWANVINLSKLNMGNCERCIGGQLYGEFEWFLDKYKLDAQDAVDRGFDLNLNEKVPSYRQFNKEWRRVIRERRGE